MFVPEICGIGNFSRRRWDRVMGGRKPTLCEGLEMSVEYAVTIC